MKRISIILGILSVVALGGVASAEDFSGGACTSPVQWVGKVQYCAVYGPNGSYSQTYGKGGLYCSLYGYNC